MDSAWEVNQGTNKTYVADYAHIGRYLDDTLYGIDSGMIKYNTVFLLLVRPPPLPENWFTIN